MDMLGEIGVIADDDQDRRRPVLAGSRVLHILVPPLPLTGERKKRVFGPAVERIRFRPSAGQTLSGFQILGDVAPEPEVLGFGLAGAVGGREPRDLRDPALDRIHQAKIADDPGERGPFGVTASRDVERRG